MYLSPCPLALSMRVAYRPLFLRPISCLVSSLQPPPLLHTTPTLPTHPRPPMPSDRHLPPPPLRQDQEHPPSSSSSTPLLLPPLPTTTTTPIPAAAAPAPPPPFSQYHTPLCISKEEPLLPSSPFKGVRCWTTTSSTWRATWWLALWGARWGSWAPSWPWR
jgi:hypothetical protein